ncbi:hypothetical protein J056_001204 [Wallemia ichthyophaga EXF-994]|uniref:Uncharacterized protein n=1 Tax=Wallemia ichthyophaga (strain EXF-994 / CBS 113033) TaxID=1299270 RepID=R9AD00_WALI9|nr:uncharacterized protein J056_001204 [Wallemia ichthyophaga EXF-994]EOQ99974.1 hypothetical protein J056_001204 [Wallemia ichthyophaga EXF-994]
MSYYENNQQGNSANYPPQYVNPASLSSGEQQQSNTDDSFKLDTITSTRFPTPPSSNEHLIELDGGPTGDFNIGYNFLPTPESSPYESDFNLEIPSAPMSHAMSQEISSDMSIGMANNFGNSLGMFYPTPPTSSMGSMQSNMFSVDQTGVDQELHRLLMQSGASAHIEQLHQEERQRVTHAYRLQQQEEEEQQRQQQQQQEEHEQEQQRLHQRMMFEKMQQVNISQQQTQQAQNTQTHYRQPPPPPTGHPYRIAEQSTRSIRRKQSAPAFRSTQAQSTSMGVHPAATTSMNMSMGIHPSATIAYPQASTSSLGRIEESQPQPQREPQSLPQRQPQPYGQPQVTSNGQSSCHRNVRGIKSKRQGGPRKAISMPAIRQVSSIQAEDKSQPKMTKSPGGISFINFTQEHAEALIAGVAPSGSNKRKKKAAAAAAQQ